MLYLVLVVGSRTEMIESVQSEGMDPMRARKCSSELVNNDVQLDIVNIMGNY